MSGNQASCSIRLLKKNFTAPSSPYFCSHSCFISFVVALSLGRFTPKIHDETKWLMEKLQQNKLVCLSSTQAGWRCYLQLSLSSHQRPVLEHRAHHLFQWPISTSRPPPHAKKRSVEQPIGKYTLWNYLWLAEKTPSWSSFSPGLNTECKKRCSVVSDHLNYNMLKVIRAQPIYQFANISVSANTFSDMCHYWKKGEKMVGLVI